MLWMSHVGRVAYFSEKKNLLHGFRFYICKFYSRPQPSSGNIVGHVVHSAVCNYPISNLRVECAGNKYFLHTLFDVATKISTESLDSNHKFTSNAMANRLLF